MIAWKRDVESIITLDLQKQVRRSCDASKFCKKQMKLSHTNYHDKMVGLLHPQDLGKFFLSVIKFGFV